MFSHLKRFGIQLRGGRSPAPPWWLGLKAIGRGGDVGVVVGIEKAIGRGDDVGGQDGVEEVRTVC